jgi:hypothetical protein
MVEARRPLVDAVLSTAPAAPGSVHGQWLSHVLLYAAYALTGETGLRLAVGLLAALVFGLVMAAGSALGGTPRAVALGALLASGVAANNLGLRAQVFSYVLFALVSLLLVWRHRYPRALYGIPLVFAAWANLHGAFLTGLILIGLHAAHAALGAIVARLKGQPASWRDPLSLLVVLALSVLATSLSPLGVGVYPYVWSIATYSSSKTLIPEWQPTTIQSYAGQAMAAGSLLIGLVLWKTRRAVDRFDVLVLLVFGALALTSQRQVVWWGLVAGPILARYASALPTPGWLTPTQPDPSAQSSTRGGPNLILAAVLVAFALASPLWRPALAARIDGASAERLYAPSGVVDAAATLPEGARLYVFQPWTGYVVWRLWPHQQSMVDARFETHPDAVWDDYLAIGAGRADWEQILERYQIEYLVLEAEQQGYLARLALRSGRWVQVYRDAAGLILKKMD